MKKLIYAVLLAVVSLLACPLSAQQNPILFVTQVPNPTDFTTANSPFGNQLATLESIARGGDLYIRYPSGALKNLTAAAGFGSVGFQGANAIAVRDPSVHWSGTKALFCMVVGAPTKQFQVGSYRWQIYEITGLGMNETPVITKLPNQPAEYNNVAPVYGSDDRIIFGSDRPRNGLSHLYPQLDEYEVAPTVSGLWSLNAVTGDLLLLEHSPSGSFSPIVDSFGRVIFTRWDHLQQDQLGDDEAPGTAGTYGMFDYTNESAMAQKLFGVRNDIYPEARRQIGNVNRHLFNVFFPWMIEQNGTGMETVNHVGRHELSIFFDRSFNNDGNLQEFDAPAGSQARRLANDAILQMQEDPLVPGRFVGVSAAEFATHACGQIVALRGAPGINADTMQIESLTHPDTAHADPAPSPNHSGLYRNPLPTSDGLLIASHTPSTLQDSNTGAGEAVGSRYDLRLKRLMLSGTYFVPAGNLTPGISKSVDWWDPDAHRTYSGPLWELQAVEVRARPRPAPRVDPGLESPEAAVFTRAGVDVSTFKNYLRTNDLALIVMRNVTSRDDADRQQPFNLHVPGGVVSASLGGTVYDVSFLQLFQGDQVRGRGLFSAAGTPNDGRRVLARELHDALATNGPAVAGAPAGGMQIAPDGSVAVLVPARRALTWQLTSPTATPVVRERFWLSFQAGEIRTCVSCHGVNDRDQLNRPAPQNEPQALAVLLANWKGTGASPPPPPPPPPAAVPAAPTSLSASAVSTSQINLAWTDASDNETGFQIERSTSGGAFTLVTMVASNATSFSNSGLAASTTYAFRVRAVNGTGNSGFTSTATATTQAAPPPPPPAPTVPAAPAGLFASAASSTQINLSWTDASSNEDGFQIERSIAGGAFSLLSSVGPNVTAFSNSGLIASTVYSYRIRAVNTAGNSAFAAIATATTPAVPGGTGASGAVFFVSTTGSNANNGLTLATAFATLQFCADRAAAGDTYLVADGSYAGFNQTHSGSAGQPITFKATGSACRITTSNTFTQRDGINLEGASWIVIDGFICSNLPRAGIRAVNGDNCIVRHNTCESNGTWGIFTGFTNDLLVENNVCALSQTQHGIYVSNSSDRVTIRGNLSHHNFASGIQINADVSQGGDGISSNCRIYNNTIWENGTGGGAALNFDGVVGAEIFNNLLYENHSTGIALFQQDGAVGSSGAIIFNNTIVQAANARWCVLLVNGATGTTLRNNIIITQHPTHGTIGVDSSSIAGLSSDFNIVTNRLSTDGDGAAITLAQWRVATGQDAHSSIAPATDSLFVNRASGNFQLAAGSAAIDAGTALTFPGASLDALGVARPQGVAVDLGAYEFASGVTPPPPPPPPPPSVPAAPSVLSATAISPSQINLAWTDNSSDETGFEIQRATASGAFAAVTTVGANVTSFSNTGLPAGTAFAFRIRAVNAAGSSAFTNTALAATPPSIGGTTTLALTSIAAEDGRILEAKETSNTGGTVNSSNSGAAALRAGDDSGDRQYKSILSFDTSSIPVDATIVSATLRLTRGSVTGTNPFTTHGACWVDIRGGAGFGDSTALQASDFQAAADATQVASLSNAVSNGAVSTGALNAAGRAAINKTGKTQFRIYFTLDDNDDRSADYIGWFSGENATPSNRPVLEIVYQ